MPSRILNSREWTLAIREIRIRYDYYRQKWPSAAQGFLLRDWWHLVDETLEDPGPPPPKVREVRR